MVDEAADILAPDQRDVLAELVPVQLQQAAAVVAFLSGHFVEHRGAAGIVVPQALGDVGVDATVLFLVGDRQGEDLAFGQVGEIAHGGECGGWRERVKRRTK